MHEGKVIFLHFVTVILEKGWTLLSKNVTLNIGQDLLERNNFKCYCQHKNGRDRKNGIMCGLVEMKNRTVVGDFSGIIHCGFDEWCTGPSQIDEAIPGLNYGKKFLCTKGRL